MLDKANKCSQDFSCILYISVRLIDDLLAYAENENLDGILFAADIEQAFDSVEHNFIFASLKKFSFGKTLIGGLKRS